MRYILYTGPQPSIGVGLYSAGLFHVFHRWGAPVGFPDEIAEQILKNPGFIERGFAVRNWLEKNPGKRIELRRVSALGDVLQLLIALNDFPELKDRVRIFTQFRYKELVERFWGPSFSGQPDLVINFDGLVERDATDPEFSKFHRIDIYRQALGFPCEVPCKFLEQDHSSYWTSAILDLPGTPYWILNQKGSRIDNSLHPETLKSCVEILRKKIPVVLITDNPQSELDYPDNLPWRELFKLVAGAKRVICTDSGLLWVAHFTRTPVTVILRKSRPEQRLTYAPSGSRCVDLLTFPESELSRGTEPYVFSGSPEMLAEQILKSFEP